MTTQVKGHPFEVLIPSGFNVTGAVLSDQLKSLDWRARKARFIGTLPADIVNKVLARAALLLSLAR